MFGGVRYVAILALLASSLAAQSPPRTRVIVLGVTHTAQLTREYQQPAVLRAFFNRVRPAAIGVERAPEQLTRGDHYEFTYEIQHIGIPWAREHGVAVHAIDWIPPTEDQRLMFGLDLEDPPILRPRSGFQSFFTVQEPLGGSLFYAESDSVRKDARAWAETPVTRAQSEFARRLFLYRTAMQARRIVQMARQHRGQTVLVVIGSMHKDDVERILADDTSIEVVQPSAIGLPAPAAIDSQVRREDLLAIATFNLLGLQSNDGVVEWSWIKRVVERLRRERETPEVALLATRLMVLDSTMSASRAESTYARIAREAGVEARFTWTGVRDGRRLDSFIDPFGNLRVAQRARLERARELRKLGRATEVAQLRAELRAELTAVQQAQLDGYWEEFVTRAR